MFIQTYNRLQEEAKAIRQEVFVAEKGFQNEFDPLDSRASHLVLFCDGLAAATCRIYFHPELGGYVIGRVAVRKPWRGRGFGAALLREAEREICRLGGGSAALLSQARAAGVYESQGYRAEGDPCLDEGCPHIWMRKILVK